ncbi:MAG: exopolyphosphatase [Moraxellaceae bacterium]|nr:exopolyphosphatase [Moraxellaceae bacterium]
MSPPARLREGGLMAAVDLGSNSFHLAVARFDHGEVKLIQGLSEKVQLGAGFDESGRLTDEAQARALACLSRFARHLEGVDTSFLRIVGTNALRVAKNAPAFLKRAEKILQRPIEVIAGREEARLIYLGVSHTLAGSGRRLVVDIGGGSTEFIIGDNFEPLATESLHMGCVSFTSRFFPEGVITARHFERAITAARQELASIETQYRDLGWDAVVGSSGTIKAVCQVMQQLGLASDTGRITAQGLQELRRQILKLGHVSDIVLPGLKEDRKPILPAGLAIVCAVFDALGIQEMEYSDGALREGVLYDMLGRLRHEDVRDRSVQAMMARYHVDAAQATRVAQTASGLLVQVEGQLALNEDDRDLLLRAARLHEVGLAVSHSGFHKHGAYLLRYSDMAGFSRPVQERLSLLVGSHRRKLKPEQYNAIVEAGGLTLLHLCALLRLSVLLHHSRSRDALPPITLQVDGLDYVLSFPAGWLQGQPLMAEDLSLESAVFAALGLSLCWR